ncbi:MAG: hypothetical protein PWQ57_3269 [Desulfovibrionales bacterium]|nr:hypothetical protein [Desulfovibrionales bacterium]
MRRNPPPGQRPKSSTATEQRPIRRPKVGVVLGGAGIRGFAGLPVVDMLARERIKVDLIVGNSGGAFLAALWSGGYNLNQIKNLFLLDTTRKALMEFENQRKDIFRNTPPETFSLRTGVYKPDVLRRAFDCIFKDLCVEALTPSTVITATDLRSGEAAAIESGYVADAVYAAGALYPLMPPLPLADLLLADGSYSSPLPVMEAVKRGMDIIIAVTAADVHQEEPSGFLECFMHVIRHSAGHLQRSQSALSVDMHHHEILHVVAPVTQQVSFWDIEKLEFVLACADRAAQDSLPEIQRQIQSFRSVQMREREIP